MQQIELTLVLLQLHRSQLTQPRTTLVKTPKKSGEKAKKTELRIKQNIAGYTKFFTFSPIGTALLANAGMFIYASIILQTLEKSRKYLVHTTTSSAKSAKSAQTAQTTLYKQISRSLSSTSSNDSGPKLRQKQKPSIERYIFQQILSKLCQVKVVN